MSINEVMKIGTAGMTEEQRQTEQERRLKVVEKLNKMNEKIERINVQLKILPAEYGVCKIWRQRKAGYNRQIRKIKADESEWLKVVAWFMY